MISARLPGRAVERAAAGDWPVLVSGNGAAGRLTEPLDAEARARLDWYESAFGYALRSVTVETADGPVDALVYEAGDGCGGAGKPWSLGSWIAADGARTLVAADEVMHARGRVAAEEVASLIGIIHARAQGVLEVRRHRRPVTVGGGAEGAEVSVRSVEYPYLGFHRMEEWRIDHPRFDGTRSGTIQRAVTHTTDAATVLPYDAARDRVLLVEQLRLGPLAKGDPLPWMTEPVAGLIDAGEDPETAAIRELEEEAGLRVGRDALRFVARYYPSPGGLAQVLHSFVALCDLPDEAAGLHGLESEGEDIRGHLVPRADLLAMVASGEAANAPLVLSALWLQANVSATRG